MKKFFVINFAYFQNRKKFLSIYYAVIMLFLIYIDSLSYSTDKQNFIYKIHGERVSERESCFCCGLRFLLYFKLHYDIHIKAKLKCKFKAQSKLFAVLYSIHTYVCMGCKQREIRISDWICFCNLKYECSCCCLNEYLQLNETKKKGFYLHLHSCSCVSASTFCEIREIRTEIKIGLVLILVRTNVCFVLCFFICFCFVLWSKE